MGVAAPGVTIGAVGGGSIEDNNNNGKQRAVRTNSLALLTYYNHCRANHSAWKMSRQSYNGDRISDTTLWLNDSYRELCWTGTSILTALDCSITVVYTIPSGP